MDIRNLPTEPGGVVRWAELIAVWGRTAAEKAIASGELERVGRGRYVDALAPSPRKAAAIVQGVVSLRSAAELHGWAQKRIPKLPDVTVERTRRITADERRVVVPHWSDLPTYDVVDGVTSKRRTLVDCMRMLPLEESLPIVESALRVGDVSPSELAAIADSMRGRGRTRARGVAAMASTRPANAYESVLHALVATVPGLTAVPQVRLRSVNGQVVRPDFVDQALGIVIEAESVEWHGDQAALTRDCARYNELVTMGYVVIRFSWPQVMFQPYYVLRVLEAAVLTARRRANVA